MPIYEYRCSSCGHELESLQKFSDAPLLTCPACTKDTLVKLMSAAGFQLKGSGWYATDFKGSGSKPAAKAEGGDGKPGAAKAEGGDGRPGAAKADAKPDAAAKSETKSGAATPAAASPASTGPGPAAS
jgi:putative FmdB family regulatory protein